MKISDISFYYLFWFCWKLLSIKNTLMNNAFFLFIAGWSSTKNLSARGRDNRTTIKLVVMGLIVRFLPFLAALAQYKTYAEQGKFNRWYKYYPHKNHFLLLFFAPSVSFVTHPGLNLNSCVPDGPFVRVRSRCFR